MNDLPAEQGERPLRIAQLLNADLRPYRVPLYRKLASRDDVDLTLIIGQRAEGLGAPSAEPSIELSRVSIVRIRNVRWPGGAHRVAWQTGVLKELKKGHEVVVLSEVVHNLTIWLVSLLKKFLGVRIVLFGFGYRPPARLRGLREALRTLLLHRADALVTYTERGKATLVSQGVASEKVFVAHNTVDVDAIRSAASKLSDHDRQDLRRTLDLGDELIVISVGRLLRSKRTELLVDAMDELRRRGVGVRLLVVGDGPQLAALREKARGNRSIHFAGAIYEEPLLARYFGNADVLAVPGRVGLACVHAFAYGLPVMTTADTEVWQSPEYDYIEPGVNGVVVSAASAESYADALSDLAASADLLRKLSVGAARSGDTLSIERMAQAYVDAARYAAG